MTKKTILITGANRGIGFEAAKSLAEAGHHVILTARKEELGIVSAKKIGPNASFLFMDVTQESTVTNIKNHLLDNDQFIDVIINNAGSVFDNHRFNACPERPLDTSVTQLRNTLELNTIGAYSVIYHLFPVLSPDSRVDIINVSSGMGSLDDMGPGAPAYRISKAALNSLTVFLAHELKDTNIHVNSVCPGWVRTDLGGPNATRTPNEGIKGILWIVNEEPPINGKFIRDQEEISF